jgi:hypothetical protein
MPYKLTVGIEAEQELEAAYNWYNDRLNGLGERFLMQVEVRLDQIKKAPELFKKTKSSFREAKIHGFPFLIVYRIFSKTEIIFVASIHHTSRNPKRKYRN